MTDLLEKLKYFTGSETFYYHPLFPKFVYTEGVRFLAIEAGAFWLLEHIFAHQSDEKIKIEYFQVWKIKIEDDNSATIFVEDGNCNPIKTFDLTFTDFPLKDFTLWFTNKTLLLPNEW